MGDGGARAEGAGERFSVVIANLDGAGTLVRAVRSAVGQGVRPGDVVVVDNGSGDGGLAEVEAAVPGVRVARNGCNAGFARAVNRGLGLVAVAGTTEFCLLLNNDAVLEAGALAALAAAFDARGRLALAGGQLRYPDGRLQSAFAPLPTVWEETVPRALLKWWRPERYRRSAAGAEMRLVESVFGACLAVRRAALGEIGPLDERFFFYYEEVEWCRRAGLAGWEVAYVGGARVTHVLGQTANRHRGAARVEMERSKLVYFRLCAGWWGYGFCRGCW